MCSTLGGHLSPQFCIFSWTELLKHVREQSALQGSCISRASSAEPVCDSHCNPPGVVFPRRETGLRRLMYWFTVSGNTARRSLVQAQAESPDTFRHSSSPSQVSDEALMWPCPHRKIHVAEFLQRPAVYIVSGVMTWSLRGTRGRHSCPDKQMRMTSCKTCFKQGPER